jgi:heme/copper-type cytochrome/quinol oxidase subunit 1
MRLVWGIFAAAAIYACNFWSVEHYLAVLVLLGLAGQARRLRRWAGAWGARARLHLKVVARDWLYTTNHKKLGLLYIIFAAISGTLGTTLASLIRLELSQPGSFVFTNNGGAYHIVVAIHAILMVFFVVTPVVFGGFGNYFLPVQVGARDVAYPRLNNFSVWLLPAGLVSTLRSLWDGARVTLQGALLEPQFSGQLWEPSFSERGTWAAYEASRDPYRIQRHDAAQEAVHFVGILGEGRGVVAPEAADLAGLLPAYLRGPDMTMTMAGWTFTTPFSHSRFTGRAVDMALVGLIFATLASIMTTINLIATWRFLRGRGARYQRELFPIFLIAVFISLRLLLAVSPILTAGFVMLLADRHFFTAFFTVRAGGDILLFQHIFWFFGHPEVYILVIPGFGVASTLIPYYTRKPVSSKMHMVYAMHSIACMSFVVWGHHMYLVGIDSKARTLFMTITIMIALPSTIKICGWLVSLTNGLTFPTLELWLAVVFVSVFFVGGMSGLMVAGAGLDILLHDTYYVVGHFHVMLSGAMILSVIG